MPLKGAMCAGTGCTITPVPLGGEKTRMLSELSSCARRRSGVTGCAAPGVVPVVGMLLGTGGVGIFQCDALVLGPPPPGTWDLVEKMDFARPVVRRRKSVLKPPLGEPSGMGSEMVGL